MRSFDLPRPIPRISSQIWSFPRLYNNQFLTRLSFVASTLLSPYIDPTTTTCASIFLSCSLILVHSLHISLRAHVSVIPKNIPIHDPIGYIGVSDLRDSVRLHLDHVSTYVHHVMEYKLIFSDSVSPHFIFINAKTRALTQVLLILYNPGHYMQFNPAHFNSTAA